MFADYIRTGQVRKGSPDVALAKSLVAMSSRQLMLADKAKDDEELAPPALVGYYEALREIVEAICAMEGFKVYSHEAFTAYLKDGLKEDRISEKFDRLRRLRNGVNYYGMAVSIEETRESAKEVAELIVILKKRYLGHIT